MGNYLLIYPPRITLAVHIFCAPDNIQLIQQESCARIASIERREECEDIDDTPGNNGGAEWRGDGRDSSRVVVLRLLNIRCRVASERKPA